MARKARSNRNLYVDPDLSLSKKELAKGSKEYKDWHWGYGAKKVLDWNDKDMPRILVECGKLVRLHVRAPQFTSGRHPRRRRDAMIEFSRSVSPKAHVAYDPDHPYERLYLLVPPAQRRTLKEKFWNPSQARNLNELAAIAGGKHGKKRDYPNIMCTPIGVLTGIVYYTAKKGDATEDSGSFYIHQVGEISHVYPFLCVDASNYGFIPLLAAPAAAVAAAVGYNYVSSEEDSGSGADSIMLSDGTGNFRVSTSQIEVVSGYPSMAGKVIQSSTPWSPLSGAQYDQMIQNLASVGAGNRSKLRALLGAKRFDAIISKPQLPSSSGGGATTQEIGLAPVPFYQHRFFVPALAVIGFGGIATLIVLRGRAKS
jgi:hypothetical protein